MPTVQLPINKLQQIQPTFLFDEVFPLGAGLIKQYTMLVPFTFISISLQCQFNSTLVVAGVGSGGNIITYYNGALAGNTPYHLETGSAPITIQITITNLAANGNINIIQYAMQKA
jgi:hypothetical protein